MATEKQANGSVYAAYTQVSSTEINSLVNGNAVQLATTVSDAAPSDSFGQFSINLGSITTPSGQACYLSFYLYPLNADGSTYGDGSFSSSAAGPPSGANYLVATINLIPNVTQAQTGTSNYFPLPLGNFKIVMYNTAGVNLAASGNAVYLRTINRQVA